MSKAFSKHLSVARTPSDIRYILSNCGKLIYDNDFIERVHLKVRALLDVSTKSETEYYEDILDSMIEANIHKRIEKQNNAFKKKPVKIYEYIANNQEIKYLVEKDFSNERNLLYKVCKELILTVYKQSKLNQIKTAAICGISERSIRNKLKAFADNHHKEENESKHKESN